MSAVTKHSPSDDLHNTTHLTAVYNYTSTHCLYSLYVAL